MPIRVRYRNIDNPVAHECTIRPTPLVSISTNILKDGANEAFGVTYGITLTGTLLSDQGTPYAISHVTDTKYGLCNPNNQNGDPLIFVGPYDSFDINQSHYESFRPSKQQVPTNEAATALLQKQKALRALFAQDGQRVEITDFSEDLPAVICYPRFVSIDFSEGIYIDKCDFTIQLEADTLLFGQGNDDSLVVDQEGTLIVDPAYPMQSGVTETALLASLSGAYINSYDETWALEADEAAGETVDTPYSYRISHNINATGKTHYKPGGTKLPAWEQARTFVQNRLADNINDYPNIMGKIGNGTINLVNSYGGFNHVRSENLSESNGTYSVSENWVIASGVAYENFSTSTSSSNSEAFVSVSIDGSIKGLSQITPSGFGSSATSAYDNALIKYNDITNSGQFGLTSDAFARANNQVAVQLNSQPLSITIGSNEYNGEMSYSLSFNNRPTNIISGVLSETISVNDTYPGDVFATVPVLGRATGPVLQYVGSRTEYKRDISINLLMDYTRIPYGSGRNPLMLKKPSVIEPTASQIADLITELSPKGEPGVRKYFVSPPSESWNPKDGSYSFNLNWTYELDS